jgi:hypothetical protein
MQLSGVEDGSRLPAERERREVHARRGRGHGRGHRRGHGVGTGSEMIKHVLNNVNFEGSIGCCIRIATQSWGCSSRSCARTRARRSRSAAPSTSEEQGRPYGIVCGGGLRGQNKYSVSIVCSKTTRRRTH